MMVDLALLQSVSYIAGALGVCVAAAYYVMNLRITQKNQELSLKALEQSAKAQELSLNTQELALKTQQQNLETRQAQLFMQVFNRYDTEFWKNWLLTMSKDYGNYDEWAKDRSDLNMSAARLSVGTYMQGIGTFVKRGLLSPEIVADMISGPVIMWWQKYSEYIKEYRVRANYPTNSADLEYLYDELMKLRPVDYSPIWRPEKTRGGSQSGDN
jgi:hypothetical protein